MCYRFFINVSVIVSIINVAYNLKQASDEALMNYFDANETINRSKRSGNSPNDERLPVFNDESIYGAFLLDYILVNWPAANIVMVHVQNVESVLNCALMTALSTDCFRYRLRLMWIRRAEQYFDGCDTALPYITHHYDIPRRIYGNSYLSTFSCRRYRNFINRNPPAQQTDYDRIMNIHTPDRQSYDTEHDIYAIYERQNMTSALSYLKNHIDQFYRAIFFIMELRASGIREDEDDIYDGAIPYEVMSEQLQAMFYDDNRYGDYLLSRRRFLENTSLANDVLLEELSRTDRVREEVLIMLWNRFVISNRNVNDNTTTSTTSTPYTTSTMRSTKKGGLCSNNCGRHFIKKGKASFSESSCYSDDANINTRESKRLKESCLKQKFVDSLTNSSEKNVQVCHEFPYSNRQHETNNVYSGFIINIVNPDQSDFQDDELLAFVKQNLRCMFSPLQFLP